MTVNTITHTTFDEILAQHDFVVLDFWAPWCGPCKSFSEIFEEVAKQYPAYFFGSINIDEQSQLSNDFKIKSVPTLAVIREKVALFIESGAMPAVALHDLIIQAQNVNMEKVHAQVAKQQL